MSWIVVLMIGLEQGMAAVKAPQIESLRAGLSSFSPLTIEALAASAGCNSEDLLPFFESWLRDSYVETLKLNSTQFKQALDQGCQIAKDSFDQTRIQ
jgi:hypothetical protein